MPRFRVKIAPPIVEYELNADTQEIATALAEEKYILEHDAQSYVEVTELISV